MIMKKNFLFVILSNFTFTLFAQDTIYYENSSDYSNQSLTIKKIVNYIDSIDLYFCSRFYESGTLSKSYFSSNKDSIFYEGLLTSYDSLGNVQWYENYKHNKRNGELISFWPNGNTKRSDHYDMGKLLDGVCYDSIGNKVEYYEFEIMPEFPGGKKALLKYIYKKLTYPYEARQRRIQGTVIIQFVINTFGDIVHPKVIKAPSKSLAKAALRVVKKIQKKYQWSPGLKNGEKVRVLYTLPIKFRFS